MGLSSELKVDNTLQNEGPNKANDRCQKFEELTSSNIGSRISIIILTFAFTLLAYNILQISCLKPSGYIVDIYSIFPETLIPSLILCFPIAGLAIFSKNIKMRSAGIVLLFLILLTILIIPYSLGYYSMGRADDMSYIGEYVHISRTGHIAGWDIYPASPTIGAAITILTGLEAHIVSFIIPIVFSSLFVVGMYIFGRRFLTDRLYFNILLVSSFILYLGPYNFLNVPHALFFAFLPIFLFVILKYVKSKNFSLSAIMVILSLVLSFTHPFIFFFTLVLLLTLLILKPVTKGLLGGDIRRLRAPILIQLTCFMAWFIYSNTLLGSFKISVRAYLLEITEPVFSKSVDKFATAGLDLSSFITFLVIYYGRYIIPIIVILAFVILCYRKIDPHSDEKRSIRLLLILISIALIVELVLFVNPLIAHQVDRMANLLFIVYFQIPLFALSLLFFLNRPIRFLKSSAVKKTIVIILIATTFGLSLFGTFDSPHIQRTNSALTYNEVEGMRWTYEMRDGNYMAAPLSQIGRFHSLFDDGLKDNYSKIPDHFGYDQSTGSFVDFVSDFESHLYLVTLSCDRTMYEEIPAYKSVGRYTYADYQRLINDDSVNRIYSGRDIAISLANR
jgi:hypothetical protein